MELMNSTINDTWKLCTINDTWKLCTIGGFIGFFVLAVFLTTSPQTVELSTARSSTVITFVSTTSGSSSSPLVESQQQPQLPVHNLTSSSISTADNSTTFSPPPSGCEHNSTTTNISITTTTDASNMSSTITTASPSPSPFPSDSFSSSADASSSSLTQPPLSAVTTIDRVYDLDNAEEVAADAITATTPQEEDQQRCNIFEGRWVYRPNVSPMYSVYQCPFLEDKMSCRRNGRPDSEYEGWSWEPTHCDIPLFNGKDMLERMRGKRMLIAGDSLNRNMWESLACLLYTTISDPSKVSVDAAGSWYKVLKAKDYDFTLEFYWCPFLVELDEKHHKNGKKVLHLDKLVSSSNQWRGADVMVFDSGHWWAHRDKWDVFQYDGKTVPDMEIETAYTRALTTWKNWITANTNPNKTKVFFRSISPEHKGKQWCFNATTPILDESYINIYPKSMIRVVEGVLGGSASTAGVISYLNITKLSGYRRDAHPAMYRYEEWKWKVLTAKYMRLVPRQADCSHWCLPGLPDTWNRLLYVSLFYDWEDERRRDEVVGSGGGVIAADHDGGNNNGKDAKLRVIRGMRIKGKLGT